MRAIGFLGNRRSGRGWRQEFLGSSKPDRDQGRESGGLMLGRVRSLSHVVHVVGFWPDFSRRSSATEVGVVSGTVEFWLFVVPSTESFVAAVHRRKLPVIWEERCSARGDPAKWLRSETAVLSPSAGILTRDADCRAEGSLVQVKLLHALSSAGFSFGVGNDALHPPRLLHSQVSASSRSRPGGGDDTGRVIADRRLQREGNQGDCLHVGFGSTCIEGFTVEEIHAILHVRFFQLAVKRFLSSVGAELLATNPVANNDGGWVLCNMCLQRFFPLSHAGSEEVKWIGTSILHTGEDSGGRRHVAGGLRGEAQRRSLALVHATVHAKEGNREVGDQAMADGRLSVMQAALLSHVLTIPLSHVWCVQVAATFRLEGTNLSMGGYLNLGQLLGFLSMEPGSVPLKESAMMVELGKEGAITNRPASLDIRDCPARDDLACSTDLAGISVGAERPGTGEVLVKIVEAAQLHENGNVEIQATSANFFFSNPCACFKLKHDH
ncbi:hypothetical protein NE237_026275 [Protea cynaroides]|uniref:Uncharacterized protein n=1 Tax=Protea cynaroides TaxID=273540 RepID=A0A9Q0K0B8_9MAGN|nr:hypothetical protein NE237_026275 [Protea cynaroides]